ncbi:glycoside hydrolase family 2 protein [Amanita muscaria Koide BX008]|uniref:Beta-mannosidase A n=1 Tax=Amanita muscaria (strain Koide BX008) TaxID=946122 RepID=A0A0C2WKU4_AMAMK|nr:glycoside hydrolase family 2 protein [Amanita muscaria Koide BX008]
MKKPHLVLAAAATIGGVFDLSHLPWTLKNQNGSVQIPSSGPPSQVHIDLLNAGLITEPLLGINAAKGVFLDFTQRWIVNDNWTYTADLTPIINEYNNKENQSNFLVFYGIDTIANITWSGHPVAWVNNQFRHYIFDVTDKMTPLADSNLTIAFESAWYYGLNVTSRADAEVFPQGPGIRTSDNYEYPGVRQWLRKVASDFGWDWGPAFVPSGVYKPAYFVTLKAPSSATNSSGSSVTYSEPVGPRLAGPLFIEETSIDIYKEGQSLSIPPNEQADWLVNVTLALRSGVSSAAPTLILSIPELDLKSERFVFPTLEHSRDIQWISIIWRIPDSIPERWYPHNLGKPQLYDLHLELGLDSADTQPAPLENLKIRTGFRTIQLVQTPYSQQDVEERGITPGDQWHFDINGKPFYSLGTNVIPFDPFYARTTSEQVRWIIQSAVLSGQNMLRIWGGGTYQPSEKSVAGGVYDFYSICDELGILACSPKRKED